MTDDNKKKFGKKKSKLVVNEKTKKQTSNLASTLIYTILNWNSMPVVPLITYSTQFIFLAGGYDNMEADGYEGSNFAFGLKYNEKAKHKKVPYGIKRLAVILDESNKDVEPGTPWELEAWKQKGVRLLNTRDPETSGYLYNTLKTSQNSPMFIAVFGKQNEKLIPRKISENHKIFIYQHPTSREPIGIEKELESIKEDIRTFAEEHQLSNDWKIN